MLNPKSIDVIVIVSNNATRTGAPILLLNLLEWIKNNSGHNFIFIMQSGGELLEDYERIGKVYLWSDIARPVNKSKQVKNFPGRIFRKLLNRDNHFYSKRFIQKLDRTYKIPLIFCNTSTNGNILAELKKTIAAPIITYVHEGERLLDVNNENGLISLGLGLSNKVIAVSCYVKEVLIKKYNLRAPVPVIPGGIDVRSGNILSDTPSLLKREKIPAHTVKIMACGYPVWHKGTDFFIQIAGKMSKQRDDIHFIWLGGIAEDEGFSQMRFDIEKMNLSGKVTLITTKSNAIDYINLSDIFLVLSRNESFSLVTIEAGFLKKPVLCFDGAGGPCEIVDFKPGFIVPYADINGMCERINLLVDSSALRLEMGEYLHERVITNYSIEKSAGDLLRILDGSIEI